MIRGVLALVALLFRNALHADEASPWCRCLDTAQLTLDRVDERWNALGNLFGRAAGRLAPVHGKN
jgi:hypothetical protein